MTENTSVVTTERFKQGLTYQDYIGQINVNRDRFEQNDGTAKDALTEEDVAFFKEAVNKGASRVLVLGEDWCPDVYRGMPLIARVSEVAGIDMRVFPRDTNLDIMSEFLNKGEHQSIPTMVFYTADQQYLFHWIERPALANQETTEIDKEIEITEVVNDDDLPF